LNSRSASLAARAIERAADRHNAGWKAMWSRSQGHGTRGGFNAERPARTSCAGVIDPKVVRTALRTHVHPLALVTTGRSSPASREKSFGRNRMLTDGGSLLSQLPAGYSPLF
jgi:hypothetical protein